MCLPPSRRVASLCDWWAWVLADIGFGGGPPAKLAASKLWPALSRAYVDSKIGKLFANDESLPDNFEETAMQAEKFEMDAAEAM